MKSLGDRLNHALTLRGISQSELARRVNIKPQSIQYICSGQAQMSKHTTSIARTLNISADWLEKGLGKIEISAPNFTNNSNQKLNIPLVSWVQAGAWGQTADLFVDNEDYEYYPCPGTYSKYTFALKVKGESMSPEFIDGEIIFVDPEVEARNNSCVVIKQNGDTEATFKKLIIDGNRKYLKALNPNWPNPIIEMLPDATISGVIIGSYRKRT